MVNICAKKQSGSLKLTKTEEQVIADTDRPWNWVTWRCFCFQLDENGTKKIQTKKKQKLPSASFYNKKEQESSVGGRECLKSGSIISEESDDTNI